MYLLGISALYHNSSAALFKDDKLLYAIEEERLSRVKFDSVFPVKAIRFCLQEAGITLKDISKVFYYESPDLKLERQIEMYQDITKIPFMALKIKVLAPTEKIKNYFGESIEIEFVKHHISHAANAQYYIGHNESAHLVADAVGEKNSFWLGEYINGDFKEIDSIEFPHSLGMFYSTFTDYLGFRVNADEYKLMGLAAYGKPKYEDLILKTINKYKDNLFELDLNYYNFQNLPGEENYTDKFRKLFKEIPPVSNKDYKQTHMDLAASVQKVTESILLEKVKYIRSKTKAKNLCLSGGVALNCLANMKIEKQNLFENIFIPPNPGDAGSSIGCVAYHLLKSKAKHEKPTHSFYGQKGEYIDSFYKDISLKNIDNVTSFIAEQLYNGKVIGLFQGRSEFGPRALGNRSIIANASFKDMKDILNKKVKKREGYRPFAPIIRIEDLKNYFEANKAIPFMTKTFKVNDDKRDEIPSVVHADGTARVQTINEDNKFLYELLSECQQKYNFSVLINTSFNLSDEPIVNTTLDAYICFLRSDIDYLILDGLILDKNDIPIEEINNAKRIYKNRTRELNRNSYTF